MSARAGDAAAGRLLRSALSLVLSTGASAALGLVFWFLAARLFHAAEVGRDAALIAAMLELAAISQLNLDNGLLRFLPAAGARATRMVAGAYAANVVVALLAAGAFVLVVPAVSHDFAFLRDRPAVAAAFVAGVALWAVFALQDAVLTALRRAPWVPVENIAFGVLKIAALPLALWLALRDAVFLGWVVPAAIVTVPVTWLIFRRALPAHRAATHGAPSAPPRRADAVFLAQDYLGIVLGRAGGAVLPVAVVALLGAARNAYFYIPFTMVSAFDMVLLSIGTSLLAEGSYDERLLHDHVVTVVRRFGPLLALGVAVLVLAAPLVLLPFGRAYAHHGAGALRLLALASVPRAAIFLASAAWRVQGRGRRLLAVEAAALALLFAVLVPLADAAGLPGVGAAWLIAWAVPGAAAAAWLARVARRPSIPEVP